MVRIKTRGIGLGAQSPYIEMHFDVRDQEQMLLQGEGPHH